MENAHRPHSESCDTLMRRSHTPTCPVVADTKPGRAAERAWGLVHPGGTVTRTAPWVKPEAGAVKRIVRVLPPEATVTEAGLIDTVPGPTTAPSAVDDTPAVTRARTVATDVTSANRRMRCPRLARPVAVDTPPMTPEPPSASPFRPRPESPLRA